MTIIQWQPELGRILRQNDMTKIVVSNNPLQINWRSHGLKVRESDS